MTLLGIVGCLAFLGAASPAIPSARYENERALLFVLRGDDRAVLLLRGEPGSGGSRCDCTLLADRALRAVRLPGPAGRRLGGGGAGEASLEVLEESLVLRLRGARCCEPAWTGEERFALSRPAPLGSCTVRAAKARLEPQAGAGPLRRSVRSGERVEVVPGPGRRLDVRAPARTGAAVGTLDPADLDCAEATPAEGPAPSARLAYRMHGSLGWREAGRLTTVRRRCTGAARVTATTGADGARCFAWRLRELACAGRSEADWLGSPDLLPQVCESGGTWRLVADLGDRGECGAPQVTLRGDRLAGLALHCAWRCEEPGCVGVAEYVVGR